MICFRCLPAVFRKAFSGEEAIGVPRGERKSGGVIRQNSVRVLLARWELLGVVVVGGGFGWMRIAVGNCQRDIVNGVLA